ncbi:hypothetical protein AGMMS50267_10600 [Spirochaetia bacterium]|nr:hypothetical protein AGMMS50267_10600 [Spirochaetia bacterium]
MKIENIKIVLAIFIFGVLSLIDVYGQNNNGIFFNIGSPKTPILIGWNLGVGYERALNKNFSALFIGDVGGFIATIADADYSEDKGLEMDLQVHFRYYSLNSQFNNKLYIDMGAGYTFLSLSTSNTEISNLFKLQTEIGWKFIIYRMFLQPWVGYNISFGEINYPKTMYRDEFKYGGVNFGMSIGFIF